MTHNIKFVKKAEIGSQVYLAGDFNNWNTMEFALVDKNGKGEYAISLPLEPGCYQYKFFVDGVWCMDDNNPEVVISQMGTINNVIIVKDGTANRDIEPNNKTGQSIEGKPNPSPLAIFSHI
ncbi:MAG: glycogen-binding domain-containing protein [Victivallales bacterium]|nr:glycogen-binding domain-containing protein [Victivallales bacterium]